MIIKQNVISLLFLNASSKKGIGFEFGNLTLAPELIPTAPQTKGNVMTDGIMVFLAAINLMVTLGSRPG